MEYTARLARAALLLRSRAGSPARLLCFRLRSSLWSAFLRSFPHDAAGGAAFSSPAAARPAAACGGTRGPPPRARRLTPRMEPARTRPARPPVAAGESPAFSAATRRFGGPWMAGNGCLLYTSDAADDLLCVDLGGRRIIKKKKNKPNTSSKT